MALIDNLSRYYSRPKTFAGVPQWLYGGDDYGRYVLSVPLCIDYVIQEGLYLEANCIKSRPEKDVTLVMAYKPAAGLSGPMARLDWEPLHHHENRGGISGEWAWKRIEGTHLHSFELNQPLGWERMAKNNLPLALPVLDALNGLRDMLGYLGNLWNITDIQRIPEPEWEPRLV
ncbi:MAG: hypothetical protein ACREFD_04855 [Stellaceae bacterium]